MPTPETETGGGSTPTLHPWQFVPVLYFMQAVPVTVIQELTTVFYKDLGVSNLAITTWTSIVALPWSLQLLLGPLVDLNGTKRRWILGGQLLIAVGLCLAALALQVPNAFEVSLLILGVTGITSALCNIATDGFYILAMPKSEQAKFVGVQTTAYRLGKLFCVGVLPFIVGRMTHVPDLPVTVQSGTLEVRTPAQVTQVLDARLRVEQGVLTTDLGPLTSKVEMPAGVYAMRVENGSLVAEGITGEQSVALPNGLVLGGGSVRAPFGPAIAWTITLLVGTTIYALGYLLNRRNLPKPAEDVVAADQKPGETTRNVLRTLVLIGLGIGAFGILVATCKLLGHVIATSVPGVNLKSWILPENNAFVLGPVRQSFGAIGSELFGLALSITLAVVSATLSRRMLRGTPMADALTSFVRQSGFPAILAFILFYRFGEAMVVKMSPLFLKDSLANGGLAVSNEQLGIVKGIIGVTGIILGGLAGGFVVGKFGLRRAILPVAICMHIPNLLYAYAAANAKTLPLGLVGVPGLGPIPTTLAGIDFLEQFGYGFGFSAYMVYLMWVAQRGSFKTSHYAIGTGMGALCIAAAGAVAGVLQANLGYAGMFLWAVVLAIPGLLSLRFIPLDEPAA